MTEFRTDGYISPFNLRMLDKGNATLSPLVTLIANDIGSAVGQER